MRILSLASGSKGNATVVEHDGAFLLIDCGLNYKTLTAKLPSTFNLQPSTFLAVLLTHSHSDHTSGLKPLLNKHPDLAVYANAMTAETVIHDCGLDDNAFVCFENGQPFEIGPFEISAFSIPHDTSDPVGYLIRVGTTDPGTTDAGLADPGRAGRLGRPCETYFHGTDIGTPLDSIGVKLREADYATLESNHDPVILRASGRPPSLIQRIAGPRGHLSNDQSADLVRRFASPKLKRLGLAHLSRDCNVPHLAESTMRQTLLELNRPDIALKIYAQDEVVEL